MEETKFNEIKEKLTNLLEPGGFECYPFKVGWYNDQVQEDFHLEYDEDALGFILLSTPSMFNKTFKPFLAKQSVPNVRDPLDQCITDKINTIKEALPEHEVDVIHDYDLSGTRRARVLVQTVGHLAGAAFYYQRHDVTHQPWTPRQKIFGVSIHPKFGGWFGFRSVLIFPTVLVPFLERKYPTDCVQGDALRIELLERFNYSWQDWSYRDIIEVEEKYSEEQKTYFATLPKDRFKLIESMAKGDDVNTSTSRCLDQGHNFS